MQRISDSLSHILLQATHTRLKSLTVNDVHDGSSCIVYFIIYFITAYLDKNSYRTTHSVKERNAILENIEILSIERGTILAKSMLERNSCNRYHESGRRSVAA
jgi:hypothetical protein